MNKKDNEKEPGICFTVEFENDAWIKVGWYNQTPDDVPSCDRIHVLIKPEGEPPRGWTMTEDEAVLLVTGIEMAIDLVRDNPV